MTKKVLVPIATHTEEIEAVTIIDTLFRAGSTVTVASCEDSKTVKMSRGVTMVADELISACANNTYDLIAVPGGAGAAHCAQNSHLINLLKRQKSDGRLYAAICAAPAVVLKPHDLLNGPAVAYPSFMDQIPEKGIGRVQVSNKCVTSIGPGSSLEFALTLVELLYGEEEKKRQVEAMCVHPGCV